MLEFEKLLTEFATEWQDPILDCFVSQQICIYKVDGNWGQILSMLGMLMAVSSSQSYCQIPNKLRERVVCRNFIGLEALREIVVCRNIIGLEARFTGMFPALDRRHVGRAVR